MLHRKAQIIAAETPMKPGGYDDGLLIDTAVVGIVEELIRYLKSKRTPLGAISALRVAADGGLQGFWTRRRVWQLVKRHKLPKCVSKTSLYKTILKIAKSWNVMEMAALYRDVG
jgi:uncharacterized membrane-anchored protein